jgi:hypothetical protein
MQNASCLALCITKITSNRRCKEETQNAYEEKRELRNEYACHPLSKMPRRLFLFPLSSVTASLELARRSSCARHLIHSGTLLTGAVGGGPGAGGGRAGGVCMPDLG